MHSADRTSLARGAVRCWMALTFAAVALASCADGFSPLSSATAPVELVAAAVRTDAIRLTWAPVAQVNIQSYVIERRTDLSGPFNEVAQVPRSTLEQVTWIDTDVKPETYYGYRVIAVTGVGDRSPASVIAGARTPSRPGIDIVTSTIATAAGAIDPDGYEILIAGPDTIRATVGVDTRRRFSPLRVGRYRVTLNGLVSRCAVVGQATLDVDVTDTSATTISPVLYQVSCRDPNRGDIAVSVAVTGAALDDSFLIDVLGQAADSTLPTSERTFSSRRELPRTSPRTVFTNVRPGTYNVRIDSIASNCVLTGTVSRTVTVTPLGEPGVTFAIACRGSAPPVSSAPFVWRNRWSAASAAPGSSVTLQTTLDLSARAGQGVRGVQAVILFNPAVLRFEEEIAGQLPDLVVGTNTPGRLSLIAATTGSLRTGVVNLGSYRFTVIGASGQSVATSTSGILASSTVPFGDSVRVEEDTLSIGAGSGSANQPPVAQITGPVTGTVGTALSFSGSGSTDPDGTIVSYAWTFGDNTTATVASPGKTYATAGTFTVTLTVTDNRGVTASRTASVTITNLGTPPVGTAPIARANGPYTGQVGTALALSSAGTTNATSFSWSLGNGQTASGASPTVTYATAGTYTLVLTASGANGATSIAQATATITAPPPATNTRPLIWRNLVQAYDVANNSIALQIVYDLNANVTETPGAEALRSFTVDSLKWDASKLQFLSLNYGPGMVDVATNQPGASSGRLLLRASTSPGLDQGNLVIATIRFRPISGSGQTVTTSTFLGALIGTAATNSFSYNSRTSVVEGQFTLP